MKTLTDQEYDELWEIYNNSRATSKEVKVSKEALFHLLNDYAHLLSQRKDQ